MLILLFWVMIVAGPLFTLWVFFLLVWQTKALTSDRRFLALERPLDLESYPMISVIVPARNEERNIVRCVHSLFGFDYPRFEVLVADDGSTDRTAELVQAMAKDRLKLRLLEDIPSEDRNEWVTQKGFVLWKSVKEAKGEWILFVDADTVHKPDGLWRLVAFAKQENLGALSGSGVYVNPGFWGEILEGFLYIPVFLAIPLRKVHDPTERVGWMNGQCILFKRSVYEKIGGHQAIKDCALDDMAMGNFLKKAHIPYRFLPTAQLYECQNYVGLKEAYRGWARLLAGGSAWLGLGKRYFIGSMGVVFITSIFPFLVYPFATASTKPLLLLQMGLVIGLSALNRYSMKIPVWKAIFTPLGALFTLWVYGAGYRIRFGTGTYELRGRIMKTDGG